MIVEETMRDENAIGFQISLTPTEMLNLFCILKTAIKQGDLYAEAFNERLSKMTGDALIRLGKEKTFPDFDEWTNGCIKVGWVLPKQTDCAWK